MADQALAVAEKPRESPKNCTPTMARVSAASEGCCEARAMSQADVPMSAIEAPMAPAPSREASVSRRQAGRAIPSVSMVPAGRPVMPAPRRRELDDAFGHGDQGGTVGHDHRGPPDGQAAHGLEDLGLGLAVQSRRGLVEKQDRRIGTKAHASATRWRSPAERP